MFFLRQVPLPDEPAGFFLEEEKEFISEWMVTKINILPLQGADTVKIIFRMALPYAESCKVSGSFQCVMCIKILVIYTI